MSMNLLHTYADGVEQTEDMQHLMINQEMSDWHDAQRQSTIEHIEENSGSSRFNEDGDFTTEETI